MNQVRCVVCERQVPGFDGAHLSSEEKGDLGFHCGRCYAELLGDKWGEPVEHLEVDQVTMTDPRGREHEFHFRYNLAPRGLEAFEVQDGTPAGYCFGLLAEDDEPAPALVGRLLDRIRRGLARQHLKPCGIIEGGLSITDMVVRGHVDCELGDPTAPPPVVIDGVSVPWQQFGRMVSTFEGFQFKLEIFDPTDEIP